MSSSVRVTVALFVLLCAAPAAHAAEGPSGHYLLDGAWHERPEPADPALRDSLPGSTSLDGWRAVSAPVAINAGDFSEASYTGSVHWYRKDSRLPRARGGWRWPLRFESVSHRASVWLNGRRLGSHVGAYLPFELPARTIHRGVNRLVLRVDNRRGPEDIPPLSRRETGTFEGGWWNYNGILREVYLRKVRRLDFAHAFARPPLRCRRGAAAVAIDVRVRNVTRRPQIARVAGWFGDQAVRLGTRRIRAGGSTRLRTRLRIRNPRLWEPGRPRLYRMLLFLIDGRGRVVQRYRARPGIRSLKVNRRGRVVLNGRTVDLRGAAFHEDTADRGAALTREQIRHMFRNLRALGATVTRAHYPVSPYALELADRYGILVWSEIPVYRMESTLFNVPGIRARALRMLRQTITRDYNHPSVMVWSLGNENASRPKRGLRRYIRVATRTARRMDPTRLVGLAISGYPTVERQPIYGRLDVIGINDYFGWYPGPADTIADPSRLDAYLDRLHADYPSKALMITEVGAEANRHGPATEKGTYEFQSDFLDYHLGVYARKPFISAAIVWTLQDFRVKPGWSGGNPLPHPPVNEKGLIDDQGFRKPAFAVVQRVFGSTGPFR